MFIGREEELAFLNRLLTANNPAQAKWFCSMAVAG
jgi:hypothetical protein